MKHMPNMKNFLCKNSTKCMLLSKTSSLLCKTVHNILTKIVYHSNHITKPHGMKDYFPLGITAVNSWYNWYSSGQNAALYAINSLHLNTLKEKYMELYGKLIHRLEIYADAI